MRATTPELKALDEALKPWADSTIQKAVQDGRNLFDIEFPDPSWPDEIKEKYYLAKKLSMKLREEFMS